LARGELANHLQVEGTLGRDASGMLSAMRRWRVWDILAAITKRSV
jgi:hypothetical protein